MEDMMRKVVTTYINPDMDGIALMYAYTEFLRKRGEQADYYFEGTMKKEAEIVLNKFNIKLNNVTRIEDKDKIVLVDTNYLTEIPKTIKRENIVEIIDHHNRDSWLENRNDINVQIELIGAAATLVAERFKNENIEILSMSIDEFKKTSYYKTVKYAPSVLIIEDGKIVTFLDAEKNSDIEKYQDIDKFTEWVSKYIYLTKN